MSRRKTSSTQPGARLCTGVLGILSLLTTAGAAATRSAPALQPDYLAALSAVDHFLQAWQSSDAENGMALLTNHAKQATTTDVVEKFFSNETPAAYEIERGRMLKHGRYSFPVVLLTAKNNRVHRQFSSVVVSNTGGNDWAVDKLP